MSETIEGLLLLAATACFVVALLAAWRARATAGGLLALLAGGLLALTIALGARWVRLGHGPFTTMHEILVSNVWSLALAFTVALACCRWLAPTARYVLPLLVTMCAWMLLADASPGHLPPTYATPLLYVHTIFGKVFLGLLLVATGLAAALLARRAGGARMTGTAFPDDARVDDAVLRFASAALVAQTAMLIAGAVWAQDAWGRYWAWDSLETWAFASWAALALALHVRVSARAERRTGEPDRRRVRRRLPHVLRSALCFDGSASGRDLSRGGGDAIAGRLASR